MDPMTSLVDSIEKVSCNPIYNLLIDDDDGGNLTVGETSDLVAPNRFQLIEIHSAYNIHAVFACLKTYEFEKYGKL